MATQILPTGIKNFGSTTIDNIVLDTAGGVNIDDGHLVVTHGGNVTVDSAFQVNNTLNTTGNTTLGGTLSVTGITTLTDDVTIGSNTIAFDATNGTATFAGAGNFGNRIAVESGGFAFVAKETGGTTDKGALMNTGEFRIGPDVINISTLTARIQADGSATFNSTVRSDGGFVVYPPSDGTYSFASRNAANDAWSAYITGAGDGIFNGTVEAGRPTDNAVGGVRIARAGQLRVNFCGTNPEGTAILLGLNGGQERATIFANGSAEFLGSITAGDYPSPAAHMSAAAFYANANPKTATQLNSGVSVYQDGSNNGGITLRNTAGVTNISMIGSRGEATFAGTVTAANVTFNLEPDNDANYVTTTDVDEDGNTVETRVYNGPTLDVKDRLTKTQEALTALKTAAENNATDLAGLKAGIVAALANI